MTIQYDNETDAILVIFSDRQVVESEEVQKDVVVDYDADNEIVAVEILNAKKHPHSVDLPFVLKAAS